MRKTIMALHYENLDEHTRSYMLNEVNLDLSRNNIYMSPRLNDFGEQNYVSLLQESIKHYDDAWLAQQLRLRNCMKEREGRRKVPIYAADTLSEIEFNRYYIRGLCARAVKENKGQVQVYQGKEVSQSLPTEAMIGKNTSAEELLKDLRTFGIDPDHGLPSPISGLTVRMVEI